MTGSVYPEVEKKLPAYPFRTPRLVFRSLGDGPFEELIDEAGPGVAAVHSSRGCAFGDFDNDGDVDVVVMNIARVEADHLVVIREGAGILRRHKFGR